MAKLLIDSNNIKNIIIPNLNDGIDKLVEAITESESLDIPYGFSHKTYLKTMADAIRKEKEQAVKIQETINNDISTFNNATNEIIDNFKNVETININTRSSIIL